MEFLFLESVEWVRIWDNLFLEDFEDLVDLIDVGCLVMVFEIVGGNIKNVVVRVCYWVFYEGIRLG